FCGDPSSRDKASDTWPISNSNVQMFQEISGVRATVAANTLGHSPRADRTLCTLLDELWLISERDSRPDGDAVAVHRMKVSRCRGNQVRRRERAAAQVAWRGRRQY